MIHVAFYASTGLIHHAKVTLGIEMALLGRFAQPLNRPGIIRGQTLAGRIHSTETVLSIRMALLGSFLSPAFLSLWVTPSPNPYIRLRKYCAWE
jgi:hypothetical protein